MYIYICIYNMLSAGRSPGAEAALVGWHHLSNATCLMWAGLFYVRFVVSRITTRCYISRRV